MGNEISNTTIDFSGVGQGICGNPIAVRIEYLSYYDLNLIDTLRKVAAQLDDINEFLTSKTSLRGTECSASAPLPIHVAEWTGK